MGETKDIHLGAAHRGSVVDRSVRSIMDVGLKLSLEYDAGMRIRIFAGEEPLAEGIIKTVYVTQVANVLDQWADAHKEAGRPFDKRTALEQWSAQVNERKGHGLGPKDSVTIVEWEYVEPATEDGKAAEQGTESGPETTGA